MAFQFICPYCELESMVEDRLEGKRGPCASCGKLVTVAPPPLVAEVVKPQNRRTNSAGRFVAACLLSVAGIAFLIAFVAGLVFLAVPATQLATNTGGLSACAANLQRIGQALLTYEQDHGRFPPAYLSGADGQPRTSWRLLLLPYLGEEKLYQEIQSAQGQGLTTQVIMGSRMPAVYSCPNDVNDPTSETSYVVVTGPGMIFNGEQSCSLADITDGPADTILAVEMSGSAIGWLEPRDLDSRAFTMTVNGTEGRDIGSYHAGGAHVLFADGHVEFLSDLTTQQQLNSMLSVGAGDAVE